MPIRSTAATTPGTKVNVTGVVALLTAALAVGAWVLCVGARFRYPYDLEWMEGGMLCHALRVAEHTPIYAPPTVDFVPYLYTPLYSVLVAYLGKLFGIGYALGRSVSILAFLSALSLGVVYARRAGGSWLTAVFALAIPIAAYAPTGTYVDIARPDSLALLLTTSALLLGWWGRRSHRWIAVTALLFIASFFTKQTATPFMIGFGAALLVASWRVLPTYVATLGLVGIPLLYAMNRATQGWFWTYIFKIHQSHKFFALAAFVGAPVRLLLLLAPGIPLVVWACLRRRSPDLLYASYLALLGAFVGCVSYGTLGAFTNAFIPSVSFASLATATAAGRVLGDGADRRTASSAFVLLALTIATAPGALLVQAARVLPISLSLNRSDGTDLVPPTPPDDGYHLSRFVPTERDRRAGDELVARLRDAPGEVFIPFHPFYAHLAGKRTYLHRMGIADIGNAGMPAPAGLYEAFATRRFSLAIFNKGMEEINWYRKRVLPYYRVIDNFDGPAVVTAHITQPGIALTPAP